MQLLNGDLRDIVWLQVELQPLIHPVSRSLIKQSIWQVRAMLKESSEHLLSPSCAMAAATARPEITIVQ